MTSIFSMLPAGCGQDADANGRSASTGFGLIGSGIFSITFGTTIPSRSRIRSQSSLNFDTTASTLTHRSVLEVRQVH
jgi:hypothetical protein